MTTTKILFWVFNGLFAFIMFGSAVPDVLMQAEAVEGMHGQLGYPLYFVPFIGVCKMLGVIAILVPGYPRIKEWAYAGLIFDLLAATYSIGASHSPNGEWYYMLPILAIAAAAYIFYHKRLKLSAAATGNGFEHAQMFSV